MSLSSPGCVPAFTGDNGGATSPGVTADSITVVIVWTEYEQGVAQALQANGLAATPEQQTESDQIFAAFVNKHYELYGRKIKVIEYRTASKTSDPAAMRADAKQIVAKYHPFAVAFYAPGIMPEPMVDELARAGVVSAGAPALSDTYFKRHAPYAWGTIPQGDRVADMLGDYYCKKMWGKNATLAGDPTMRIKKRKLAIATFDDPAYLEVAQRLKQQVTGGMCGTNQDGTTIYTLSSDGNTALQQAPAVVARMKNDGITTVTSVTTGLPGTQFNDSQEYYPENLTSGVGDIDDDTVGQFFSQTFSSPTQMQNTFGIGWYPKMVPASEREFYLVAHDINPNYDPPYITLGAWDDMSLFGKLFQWAGPKLTPQTVEQGARQGEQINGWINAKPWNGWKCCNPLAPQWNLSSPSSYTAWADAREIYWSSAEPSPVNGKPGTWKCVNDCKRYAVGEWSKGEPKQPS